MAVLNIHRVYRKMQFARRSVMAQTAKKSDTPRRKLQVGWAPGGSYVINCGAKIADENLSRKTAASRR
jgi:hypothetical protein